MNSERLNYKRVERAHRDKLNRQITKYFPDLPKLDFSEFRNSVRAVHDFFVKKGCPVYNDKLPTEDWFITYIHQQPNIFLVRDDVGLGSPTHGAVVKEKFVLECGKTVYYYLLLVSPRVSDPVERCLTIAHELGHIFLHGRLLQPGMMVKRRYMAWYQEDCNLRHQMEAEANIYALLSLVPSTVINEVESRAGRDENELIDMVTYVLGCLYQTPIHRKLVRERLLIEDVFRLAAAETTSCQIIPAYEAPYEDTVSNKFDELFESPTWILNSSLNDHEFEYIEDPPMSSKMLNKVVNALVDLGTIKFAQSKLALRYAGCGF